MVSVGTESEYVRRDVASTSRILTPGVLAREDGGATSSMPSRISEPRRHLSSALNIIILDYWILHAFRFLELIWIMVHVPARYD